MKSSKSLVLLIAILFIGSFCSVQMSAINKTTTVDKISLDYESNINTFQLINDLESKSIFPKLKKKKKKKKKRKKGKVIKKEKKKREIRSKRESSDSAKSDGFGSKSKLIKNLLKSWILTSLGSILSFVLVIPVSYTHLTLPTTPYV